MSKTERAERDAFVKEMGHELYERRVELGRSNDPIKKRMVDMTRSAIREAAGKMSSLQVKLETPIRRSFLVRPWLGESDSDWVMYGGSATHPAVFDEIGSMVRFVEALHDQGLVLDGLTEGLGVDDAATVRAVSGWTPAQMEMFADALWDNKKWFASYRSGVRKLYDAIDTVERRMNSWREKVANAWPELVEEVGEDVLLWDIVHESQKKLAWRYR